MDELAQLKDMSNDEIDCGDIPPLTDKQIANLRLYKFIKKETQIFGIGIRVK